MFQRVGRLLSSSSDGSSCSCFFCLGFCLRFGSFVISRSFAFSCLALSGFGGSFLSKLVRVLTRHEEIKLLADRVNDFAPRSIGVS